MIALLCTSAFAGVLVNELVYDPASSDDGAEWIELCNNGSAAVDLTGWAVEAGGTSFGECFELTATGSIAPGEYLLVGAGSALWPGSFEPNLQNGGGTADGIRLLDASGAVVDTLLYGGTAGSLTDDGGQAGRVAPEATSGKSIGRWNGAGDCADSDDASVDFSVYDAPTPGTANPDPAPDTGAGGEADCSAVGDVRLNELLSNPAGSDDGLEWVELYNRGTVAVDVSGWVVRGATKSTGGSSATLPADTLIEAGGFVVVGSGGIGSVSLGNGTGGDGAYLECGGTVVDAVVYGDDNSDALLDDFGTAATSLAEVPGEDVALARRADGADTDLSADDWTSASVNTPGAPNQTPQCDPAGADGLRINEVLYDPAEDDATQEFVELYNAGSAPIQLEGFVLEAAKSSWSDNATLPAGATLEPGAFYVVGAGDVSGQDYSAAGLDLGNGTGGDGVRIFACDGTLLDTVLYGGEDDDGLEGDGGATDVVDASGSGASIGRYPDGVDSDQHTDWVPYDEPSPGEANADPGADPGDSGDTGGDDTGATVEPGCAPNPERPDGGCMTGVLPLRGLELGLVALLVARRRTRG